MERARQVDRLAHLTKRIRREHYFLVAALLIAAAAAWPAFSQAGLVNTRGGGDSPFLLQRLQQLITALQDGHFPVRWMPDANYGYGYPFYNYYASLSIYIAACFRILGFSYVSAIKLAQLSGFIVAAWAMYALARRWLGGLWPGLLAAAAYTLAPFHLVNIYVRGDSLAEFWAMAIYPLVFLTLDKILGFSHQIRSRSFVVPGRFRKFLIVGLALAYGALILSHNISALIFSPFVMLILFFHSPAIQNRTEEKRPGLKAQLWELRWPVLALLLGLALSAWFWLPALAERTLAQLETVTSGYFHYSNHFRELGFLQDKSLIQSSFFFDYDVGGGRAFRMGLIQALLIVLGVVSLLVPRRLLKQNMLAPHHKFQISNSIRLVLIGGLVIATFMISPVSSFLWERLTLLSFTQFPWRFLSIQAFFGSLIIASLARYQRQSLFGVAIIGLLLFSSLGRLKVDFLPLSDNDVTSERLAQYEWFTGNIGSTVNAEYLPNTVQPRPYTSSWLNLDQRDLVQDLEQNLTHASNQSRKSTSQNWIISANEPGSEVVIPTLNWPGWSASTVSTIADEKNLYPAAGSGLITTKFPGGEETVQFELEDTPIRIVGNWLSLIAFGIVAGLLISARQNIFRKKHAYIVLCLVAIFILTRIWPEKQYTQADLTWDFNQMAYLHHDIDGVKFDNGAILDSYQYSSDELQAGEELTISLDWRQASPEQVKIALTTPASNRYDAVPVISEATAVLKQGITEIRLDIPKNSPAGLFIPHIVLDQAKPLTPSGEVRGDLFLRPVRIYNQGELATGEEQQIDARPVLVKQRDANTLDIQLQWLTRKPLSQNFNFSLRLLDSAGRWIAQLDQQPGYGFQPSSSWPVGEWVNDWLALSLPPNPPTRSNQQPLMLVALLYDVRDNAVQLTRPLGQLLYQHDQYTFTVQEPLYSLPLGVKPLEEVFGGVIALDGYDLEQSDISVTLTLYWQALSGDLANYTHFVHLVNLESGEIVTQHDSLPQNDSYPTNLWSLDEIVADQITLNIEDLDPGEYRFQVGLYEFIDGQISRLQVSDKTNGDATVLPIPEALTINQGS